MESLKQAFKKNKFIIVLLLVTFFLRIPSLFEPYWYGDEGIYLTLGIGLRKGLLLYRDIFDNKPPLIYFLAALANGRQFWFRFFLDASILASIYFFYKLCQEFLAENNRAVKVSTILFAFITTIRFLEGNIANAEMFALLPTILGFYLLFSFKNPSKRSLLIIGAVLGLAPLFKVPAGLDFVALIVYLVISQKGKEKKFFGKKEFLLFLGFLLPLVLTSVFFALRGSFSLFIKSAFLQMFGYLTSWETGSQLFTPLSFLKSDFFIKTTLLVMLVVLVWLKKIQTSGSRLLILLWFAFSFFSATLSGRPYPHYLIQIVPSFILGIGLFLAGFKKKDLFYLLFSLFIILLSFKHYCFGTYPSLSYYHNFLKFVLGQKKTSDYFSYFDKKTPPIYSTADFIVNHTQNEDKIFIWSNEASLYALSRRLPATPYVAAYHIIDFNHFAEVLKTVKNKKIPLVVVDQQIGRFPELEAILEINYLKIIEENPFSIYIIRKTI